MNAELASGIYCFLNTVNGKRYIGQAVCLRKRKLAHIQRLRSGRGANQHFQNAYNKFGENSFTYYVIERCALEKLTEREQFWVDYFGLRNLYNKRPAVDSSRGVSVSNETRRKMSESRKGRKFTAEHRANLSISQKEKPLSEKKLVAIKAAHIGKVVSEETRAKLRAANIGKKLPEGTKDKLCRALTGHRMSEKCREALRKSNFGRNHSDSAKKKISVAKKGKPLSIEHRLKRKEAQRNRPPISELTRARMSRARSIYYENLRAQR